MRIWPIREILFPGKILILVRHAGGMAKKRRNNMSRYVKGSVALDLPLTTLAAQDVTTVNTPAVASVMRCTSIVASYVVQGFDESAGAGQGPVAFGWAHGDYSATEIEEYFENESSSWIEGDLVTREIRSRLIRTVGTFGFGDSSSGGVVSVNNNQPIKTKLNWLIEDGETLQFFAYNAGSGALVGLSEIYAEGYANLFGV